MKSTTFEKLRIRGTGQDFFRPIRFNRKEERSHLILSKVKPASAKIRYLRPDTEVYGNTGFSQGTERQSDSL